jgi:uncharacterized membrane protein
MEKESRRLTIETAGISALFIALAFTSVPFWVVVVLLVVLVLLLMLQGYLMARATIEREEREQATPRRQ